MPLNPFEQLRLHVTGAAEAFEDVAADILRAVFAKSRRVRVHQGDGGVDVFRGTYGGGGAVDVYQIKYFPEGFGESQRGQIRDSFKTVRDNPDFTLGTWFLCVPLRLSREDLRWFEGWKAKQEGASIELIDGDELEDFLREPGCAHVRERLAKWGVTGTAAFHPRFALWLMVTKSFRRFSSDTFTFDVKLIVEGAITARNLVVDVYHAETGRVGFRADSNWWLAQETGFNAQRLTCLRNPNPGEVVPVLTVPVQNTTAYPFWFKVRTSAQDTPLCFYRASISAEEAERGGRFAFTTEAA